MPDERRLFAAAAAGSWEVLLQGCGGGGAQRRPGPLRRPEEEPRFEKMALILGERVEVHEDAPRLCGEIHSDSFESFPVNGKFS